MRTDPALVIAALVVVFLLLVPCACYNPVASAVARYDVNGTVESAPSSKMSMIMTKEGGSGSQKYAVRVDGTIYNCSSTQCSQLVEGDEVTLSCYREWHLFEPDEEECRFQSLSK